MSTVKKPAKGPEEIQAAMQNLIAQGRKDGMIRANDLNALLEKMDLSPDKIEEIYRDYVDYDRVNEESKKLLCKIGL